MFMFNATQVAIEEHVHGETTWVALRSRGAEWSWITPDEAVRLGKLLIDRYGGLPVEEATRH